LPALIPETEITFRGTVPFAYQWSERIRKVLGFSGFTGITENN